MARQKCGGFEKFTRHWKSYIISKITPVLPRYCKCSEANSVAACIVGNMVAMVTG
ncbi:hypothetical protein AMELA_G00215510 [Ameiurus melas]|uniref:Uncharacterized protein n=1 Tax=Ameiurus melas TaxID=219545 RepID=A0A7J6A2R8_AMEME|nr:hypothetical protein AMELA_G00215510 [Ameiurus melas]